MSEHAWDEGVQQEQRAEQAADDPTDYMESTSAEKLAQRFHEAYERLAPEFGYKTREASAVPWEDVPADNKALMVAVAGEVMESTSRLRAENEELREQLDEITSECCKLGMAGGLMQCRADAAEATMREVAEELRGVAPDFEPVLGKHADHLHSLADRLDPPPAGGKKTCPHPKACWGEMVCLSVEGGGRLCDDARLDPPPVVEKPMSKGAIPFDNIRLSGVEERVDEIAQHKEPEEDLYRELPDEGNGPPPPAVEKPLHAYFPSDVNAGSRSPCVHCGQAYDAHVPPPVVEKP